MKEELARLTKTIKENATKGLIVGKQTNYVKWIEKIESLHNKIEGEVTASEDY